MGEIIYLFLRSRIMLYSRLKGFRTTMELNTGNFVRLGKYYFVRNTLKTLTVKNLKDITYNVPQEIEKKLKSSYSLKISQLNEI